MLIPESIVEQFVEYLKEEDLLKELEGDNLENELSTFMDTRIHLMTDDEKEMSYYLSEHGYLEVLSELMYQLTNDLINV